MFYRLTLGGSHPGSQALPEIHEVFAGDPERMDRPKVGSRVGDDGFVRRGFFLGGPWIFVRKSGNFWGKRCFNLGVIEIVRFLTFTKMQFDLMGDVAGHTSCFFVTLKRYL